MVWASTISTTGEAAEITYHVTGNLTYDDFCTVPTGCSYFYVGPFPTPPAYLPPTVGLSGMFSFVDTALSGSGAESVDLASFSIGTDDSRTLIDFINFSDFVFQKRVFFVDGTPASISISAEGAIPGFTPPTTYSVRLNPGGGTTANFITIAGSGLNTAELSNVAFQAWVVPEPATLLLLGTGLVLAGYRRRKARSQS